MNLRGWLLAAITTAAVLVLPLPPGAGASVSRDVSPVFRVPAFTPVAAAPSTLVRLVNGIAFALRTSELTPGTPATLLLIIFNRPEGFSHGGKGCAVERATSSPAVPHMSRSWW